MTKCWKFHCQGQVHCQGHGQLVATNASRERPFDRQGDLFFVLLKLVVVMFCEQFLNNVVQLAQLDTRSLANIQFDLNELNQIN